MSPPARAPLLAWYDLHKRDLPWRRTRDPYAIWVSEIMCQQTRVETVIPYWERFLARFPNATTLAQADEDDVLALWSGLGYYRRARLLHRGVKEVVERYGGDVPEDREARLSLPGVGRYTAGALGSIAFGLEEPVVDGNVMRVLSRVHGVDTPLGQKHTETVLWGHAARWVRGPRPGDLNQAIMELGARVCVPKRPRCDLCPIAGACVARATERTDELPVPKAKKPPRPVTMVAVVPCRGCDEVALARGEAALFGGLYGVPMIEGAGRDAALEALRAAKVRARLDREPSGTVEHVLSHRRLRVTVYRATRSVVRDPGPTRRLLRFDALDEVGISTLTRKLIQVVRSPS
ncbi:MAG: A/G-specific adenine glycosylase [Sandaracinaceae bacterium]